MTVPIFRHDRHEADRTLRACSEGYPARLSRSPGAVLETRGGRCASGAITAGRSGGRPRRCASGLAEGGLTACCGNGLIRALSDGRKYGQELLRRKLLCGLNGGRRVRRLRAHPTLRTGARRVGQIARHVGVDTNDSVLRRAPRVENHSPPARGLRRIVRGMCGLADIKGSPARRCR